jgi:uncharacterized protein YkwD
MRFPFVTLLFASLFGIVVAPSTAALAQEDKTLANRVLDLTNPERTKAGLVPLSISSELNDAAQKYSRVLAADGCFAHTCGPVPDFAERAGQAGYTEYTALAENIAAGYATPDAVVAGWMASPGHRANILSPNYTEMGIGMVNSGGKFGSYWTQEFGARQAATMHFATLPAPPESEPIDDSEGDADLAA